MRGAFCARPPSTPGLEGYLVDLVSPFAFVFVYHRPICVFVLRFASQHPAAIEIPGFGSCVDPWNPPPPGGVVVNEPFGVSFDSSSSVQTDVTAALMRATVNIIVINFYSVEPHRGHVRILGVVGYPSMPINSFDVGVYVALVHSTSYRNGVLRNPVRC